MCNKALGVDGITAELLKVGGDIMVQWLTQLSKSYGLVKKCLLTGENNYPFLYIEKVLMRVVINLGALPYSVFQERSFVGFFKTG